MRRGTSPATIMMLILLVGVPLWLIGEHPVIAILILLLVLAPIVIKLIYGYTMTREGRTSNMDQMSGEEFEHYVADLMRNNGFRGVQVTKASGDYGVDIIAKRGGDKYAVQCKRYEGSVGVKPVQEVFSGARMYRATRCAVATNSGFTEAGRRMAKELGVELWDRGWLIQMARK